MFGDNQVFSQTLSLGFGNPVQQISPQKKTRQEDKQACFPTFVEHVLSAVGNVGNGDLRIHGEEVSMIMVVGVAEAVVNQAASVEFILNDSTGRLKVRQYLTDSNQNAIGFSNGHYVSVVGQMRTAPEVHMSAQFLSVVDSPDQISYHVIEATHAMLKLTKAKADPMTPAPKRPVATPQISVTNVPPQTEDMVVDTPQKESKIAVSSSPGSKLKGDVLRSALISFLQQQSSNHPEGLKFGDIAKQMEPVVEVEVRACLESLVGDGEVFNTIDDEHFSTV